MPRQTYEEARQELRWVWEALKWTLLDVLHVEWLVKKIVNGLNWWQRWRNSR